MAEKKSENAKAAAKKTAKKPNVFKRLAKYLGSCKSEIKKITWPTAKQTTKNFGIVIAMVAIVGVFIFALIRFVRSRWSFYEHNRLIRI